MMSHDNLAANATTLHTLWGWQPDDVLLHALPIFHTHGLFVATNCVLLNGSPMIFCPKFDAEQVLDLLPQASVFMGVPTFYTRLLASPRLNPQTCRTMRLFISGSAPLLAETFAEFAARTGHTILERYGMVEGDVHLEPAGGGARLALSARPCPMVVRTPTTTPRPAPGEVGGIEVKGPNVFIGH